MSMLGTEERPLRVAIVGSGPSGFYAAEALLSAEPKVRVDVYESLPAPFGLVRYGVAPDHEKIKNVIKVYERTAQQAGFAFFGNVRVGEDVTVEELRAHYDALIFANGAQTDRRLGIPGEDLPGSYTATEFVAWYNGHPDYVERSFDLSHEVAVVIGLGNVAVDVARILCKTVDELNNTDITAAALDVLAASRIREIHMVGRRGPVQSAFTLPEIKEFAELADCDPVVDPTDLELNAASLTELEQSSAARKILDVLEQFATRPASGKSKRFVLHFCESPVEIIGKERMEKVRFEKNALSGEPGRQKSRGTGETYEMECGAFFRSVGYRGVPIEGVPFHEAWGIFPNEEGRITSEGVPVPGLYAVGWIKRGPTGIIGTNKPDAIATVERLLGDLPTLTPCATPSSESVLDLLAERGVRVVTYDDWRKIDAAEIERGKAVGKPREKFLTRDEMLGVLG
jgi:ferredoxin--NADP+ reductase